jgi:site-specific recombinase XerD
MAIQWPSADLRGTIQHKWWCSRGGRMNHFHRGTPAQARSLEGAVDRFCSELTDSVSDPTVSSYRTTLSSFIEWYSENSEPRSLPTADHAYLFIRHAVIQLEKSIDTASGYASSLSNFLAYIRSRSPRATKIEVVANLITSDSPRLQALAQNLSTIVARSTSTKTALSRAVNCLLMYLRQCLFGSRVHVYSELLIESKSCVEQLVQIDCADINLQQGTVTVDVSQDYVVGSAGLVSKYTASISELTCEALKMYLEHEREPVSGNNEPLFTSRNGRMSVSTLRRSIGDASRTASQFPVEQLDGCTPSHNPSRLSMPVPLSPNDLYQYAALEAITPS